MLSRKVIVFGPTGAVGSAAARTAERLGAQVVLAMRNRESPIPGLDGAKEKAGKFERVYADLSKPATVLDAVQSTKAKHAFIYSVNGTDHMKSTLEALKSAGIDLVVFLSSFTVQGDPKAIQPEEVISYRHAQVELNLKDVFGAKGFVAARPGAFATNTRSCKDAFKSGNVRVQDSVIDCIVPEDIGRVCGTVLVNGPQDEERAIYLYGPELLTQADSVKVLAKLLGIDPKIQILNQEKSYKMLTEERGMSPVFAKYITRGIGKTGRQVFGYQVTEDQLHNVQKYTGTKANTFEEWAQDNNHAFVSSGL